MIVDRLLTAAVALSVTSLACSLGVIVLQLGRLACPCFAAVFMTSTGGGTKESLYSDALLLLCICHLSRDNGAFVNV
jgi:hypothetical protein